MFHKLKFLVGISLISFIYALTVSAQIFEKYDFDTKNNLEVSGEKESFETIETEENDWKIRKRLDDSKRDFFPGQRESKKFEEPSMPNFEDLPEKFDEKSENSAQTETEPTNYRFKRGEKEINIEFGISPFHPTKFGEQEYDLDDRKLGMLTVRWGRFFGTVNTVTYQYLFEANPIVYSYRNELRNPAYVSPTQTPNEPPTVRGDTFGFAVMPVVFRAYFFSKNRFKPFAQIGGGILFTNKPMPTPESTYYNFAGYFGGGALYHVTRKQGISVHYRYYHLSNFNTSDPNLGYNANTFSIGYSFFFGK